MQHRGLYLFLGFVFFLGIALAQKHHWILSLVFLSIGVVGSLVTLWWSVRLPMADAEE